MSEAEKTRARVDAWNMECLRLETHAPVQAESTAREALALAESIGYAEGQALALRNLAYLHSLRGESDPALALLQRALPLAPEPGRARAVCLHTLGLVHQNRGRWDEALACYEAALALRTELGDLGGQARTLNNIATLHFARGAFELCLAAHQMALPLWRLDNNLYGEAFTLNNIGVLHAEIGDLESALRYHDHACQVAEAVGDRKLTISCHLNRGHALRRQGHREDALTEIQLAVEMARALGDLRQEAGGLHELGLCLAESGRLDDAWATQAASLRRYGTAVEPSLTIPVLREIGVLHLRRGAPSHARRVLERCLALAGPGTSPMMLRDVHETLTDVCEAQGDLAGALAHHRRFHALDQELHGARAERRRQALLAEFEVAQARREAALQQQRTQELVRMHEQLLDTNRRLQEQARQDGMTGLLNHRAFQERLREEIAYARRMFRPLSLLLLDVDDFKGYNDTFGHPAGDAVLRQMSRLLRAAVRQHDILARYGGEEFAVLLPETDAVDARDLAERLREIVAQHPFPHRRMTVSAGVATADALIGDADELLAAADKALYAAKRGGRNQVA